MKLIEIVGLSHYINRRIKEVYALEEDLCERLGIEPGGFLSDVIYENMGDQITDSRIVEALKKEGITKYED